MIADYLSPHGYAVRIESQGDRAVEIILATKPDLVILDVNLPGRDGFEVCRVVRPGYAGPILILTARAEEVDEVVGLEIGADDYLSKPVRPRVLLARIRAHLRKAAPDGVNLAETRLVIGELEIDAACRMVVLEGCEINLTTAEFDLLWMLAQHAGQPLSRKVLNESLHEPPHDGLDRTIDLRVSRLRRKLLDDSASPRRIKSIRGVGYMLSADP
ncbi:MAG: DNA-binding response regulator [Planctomycetaceae bacterium]|nr:DNA-binding response regulator [Planctomycetaceae bacterium]